MQNYPVTIINTVSITLAIKMVVTTCPSHPHCMPINGRIHDGDSGVIFGFIKGSPVLNHSIKYVTILLLPHWRTK